jgi:hypothetical protein
MSINIEHRPIRHVRLICADSREKTQTRPPTLSINGTLYTENASTGRTYSYLYLYPLFLILRTRVQDLLQLRRMYQQKYTLIYKNVTTLLLHYVKDYPSF